MNNRALVERGKQTPPFHFCKEEDSIPRRQAKPMEHSLTTTTTHFSLFSNFSSKRPVPAEPLPSKTLKILSLSRASNNPPPPPDGGGFGLGQTLVSVLRWVPNWADDVKERGMRRKRSLYDHEKWVDHRSSLRHVRHLMSSLSSRVIVSLIPPVMALTSFAVVIASYNWAVSTGLLPGYLPVLRASPLPYQLTAPALALLLVFRTEASYSRLEEGRKAWRAVMAGSSDLAQQVIASVHNPRDALLKTALLQYVMAFPVALKCHVLYGSDIRRDLQGLLEADDLTLLLRSKHRPSCVIDFISQTIQLLNLEASKRHALESKLSCFHEGIAVCDQLIGIPIPLSYTRLTSRFLVLWHLTLPIILWDDCNWIVVPATFISAASLFCIEEVGVLIEEPFPMLALGELCSNIQRNVEDAIMSEESIRALLKAKRRCCPNEHSPNGRHIRE